MSATPFYDPSKSYDENYDQGPFGEFADGKVFERTGEPKATFLGQPVYQPFGIPAGPLVNSKYCASAFAKGFDLVVYKTVRSGAHPSHPVPNILPLNVPGDLTLDKMAAAPLVAGKEFGDPLSITNSFGVPSKPADVWQKDMAAAVTASGKGQVLIGSFQGTKKTGGTIDAFIADFVLAARLVKETGVKILEANLSCPNEGTADLLCFDTDRVGQIVDAIKTEIGDTTLIIKIAFFESDDHLSRLVQRVGGMVQAIAAINTIPARIVTEAGEQALPGEGRLVSGVCGSAIQWAGLEMTRRLHKLREDLALEFAIVGTGGVTVATDYQRYIEAGADAVMSATGAMWNPLLAQEIWKGYQ